MPDYSVYKESEILSRANFSDIGAGEYALQYLGRATCLYGKNIISERLSKIDKYRYELSLEVKIGEYNLRLRNIDISPALSLSDKLKYHQKYIVRIIRMILLREGVINYDYVDSLTGQEILTEASYCGIINFIKPYNELTYSDYRMMHESAANFFYKKEKVNKNGKSFLQILRSRN